MYTDFDAFSFFFGMLIGVLEVMMVLLIYSNKK